MSLLISEAILVALIMTGLNRLPRSPRTQAVLFVSAAIGASTPLIANSAANGPSPRSSRSWSGAAAAALSAGRPLGDLSM